MKSLALLLEEEHSLLLSADFDGLKTVATGISELLPYIPREAKPETAPLIKQVKSKSYENAKLLEATLAGLKSASDKIATARADNTSLKTYDQRGQTRKSDGSKCELSRKA